MPTTAKTVDKVENVLVRNQKPILVVTVLVLALDNARVRGQNVIFRKKLNESADLMKAAAKEIEALKFLERVLFPKSVQN